MKQQVHIWNIHNHKPIDQFISELIENGHEVKSTMATAYHNDQVIRAVVITEESEPKRLRIQLYSKSAPIEVDRLRSHQEKLFAVFSCSDNSSVFEINPLDIKSIS